MVNEKSARARNICLLAAVVLAIPFAGSVAGCSKGGTGGGEITAKDVQGDPSKMPAGARQAMQNARSAGARQGAAAQSAGGAPKIPAAPK